MLSKLARSSLFSTFSTGRFEKQACKKDCKDEGVWQESNNCWQTSRKVVDVQFCAHFQCISLENEVVPLE